MKNSNHNFQKAMNAAYTLLASVIGLGGIGYYFFYKYDNIIWFISMLILGIIVGMYELYKQIK